MRSGFEAHRDYHADVYILLRRKGQTYEFKSTDRAWPLSSEDVVRIHASFTLGETLLTDNAGELLSISKTNYCGGSSLPNE